MDNYAQVIFHQYDQTFRIMLPALIQVKPFTFNLQRVVINYFQMIAGDRKINYIVDVGACCGAFAIPYTIMFPDAEILCIEPSSANYPYLKFNCKNFPQIDTIKIAAHDTFERVRIAAPTVLQRNEPEEDLDTGLISIHGRSGKYAELVDADKLDDIVKKPVDWMKIDVEGHEIPVLRGAERIINQYRPILQVEIREDNQIMANETAAKLLIAISEMGYALSGSVRGDFIFVPK